MKRLPNLLTGARLASAPLFALLFMRETLWSYALCAALLAYAILSDWYDGRLARRYHCVSVFGQLFDPIADYVFFLTAFLCFVATGWMPLWMYVILLVREVAMHLGLRLYLAHVHVSMPARRSGKLKTALQCVVAGAGIVLVAAYHLAPAGWMLIAAWWMFLSIALVSAFSMVEYGLALRRLLSGRCA
ncbi:CDP-alcohol phosphatidyltransferase family protein [bacterium]|nr:CDP-alcohol phosphatidyltransferase family protein [bacterium]